MIDLRPALFVIGILLTTIAVAMLAPFTIDLINGHQDWKIFAAAGTLTLCLLYTSPSPRDATLSTIPSCA